jgi:hypothetical protein
MTTSQLSGKLSGRLSFDYARGCLPGAAQLAALAKSGWWLGRRRSLVAWSLLGHWLANGYVPGTRIPLPDSLFVTTVCSCSSCTPVAGPASSQPGAMLLPTAAAAATATTQPPPPATRRTRRRRSLLPPLHLRQQPATHRSACSLLCCPPGEPPEADKASLHRAGSR